MKPACSETAPKDSFDYWQSDLLSAIRRANLVVGILKDLKDMSTRWMLVDEVHQGMIIP
jgi:hypothetical protein